MKKLLANAVKGLIGIIVSAVLTAWITGQPLTGLTKLKGLYQTFVRSAVPAWVFALVFFVALFGIQYFVTHLSKESRPKLHFVPDSHNCYWSLTGPSETQMYVHIGGTFTSESDTAIALLRAYFKGTRPAQDMTVQVLAMDGSLDLVERFELDPHVPTRAFLNLYLAPATGTRGKPYRGRLIFVDQYRREYKIDCVEFSYGGR